MVRRSPSKCPGTSAIPRCVTVKPNFEWNGSCVHVSCANTDSGIKRTASRAVNFLILLFVLVCIKGWLLVCVYLIYFYISLVSFFPYLLFISAGLSYYNYSHYTCLFV